MTESRGQWTTEVGTKINAISTLVGKVLPSLFPGISYYEEGCIALEHDDEIFCVVKS
jgi:hypothetical protein